MIISNNLKKDFFCSSYHNIYFIHILHIIERQWVDNNSAACGYQKHQKHQHHQHHVAKIIGNRLFGWHIFRVFSFIKNAYFYQRLCGVPTKCKSRAKRFFQLVSLELYFKLLLLQLQALLFTPFFINKQIYIYKWIYLHTYI